MHPEIYLSAGIGWLVVLALATILAVVAAGVALVRGGLPPLLSGGAATLPLIVALLGAQLAVTMLDQSSGAFDLVATTIARSLVLRQLAFVGVAICCAPLALGAIIICVRDGSLQRKRLLILLPLFFLLLVAPAIFGLFHYQLLWGLVRALVYGAIAGGAMVALATEGSSHPVQRARIQGTVALAAVVAAGEGSALALSYIDLVSSFAMIGSPGDVIAQVLAEIDAAIPWLAAIAVFASLPLAIVAFRDRRPLYLLWLLVVPAVFLLGSVRPFLEVVFYPPK